MKNLIYTKPPWSISPQGTYIRSGGTNGWNIATIHDQHPYTEGNRALLRITPEMYEVLIDITEEWERQKNLFPVLKNDGWMELKINRAKVLLNNV